MNIIEALEKEQIAKLNKQVPGFEPGDTVIVNVKVTVRVHQYPDGRLAIFHGPRRLADYEPDGPLIDQISPARTAA